MRFILVAGIAFALVILGSRYVRSNGLRKGKPMVEEATSLISRGSLVIDVRQEACQGYVKGAHLISIEDILAKSPKALDQFQSLGQHRQPGGRRTTPEHFRRIRVERQHHGFDT